MSHGDVIRLPHSIARATDRIAIGTCSKTDHAVMRSKAKCHSETSRVRCDEGGNALRVARASTLHVVEKCDMLPFRHS